MTGVAALAICAAFTSCSKNEELFDQGAVNQNTADQVVEKYNQAFLKYVGGTIDPEQTWGFGGYSAGTRAENKNLNEWGDPAKNGGTAWDVPPALTDEQKLRVRLYFQYNPRLTYIAPDWTNFFVQQVYKGNPATKGPNSKEEYKRVNEQIVTGSNEMDYLFCATETTHINDFNDGEWNHGTKVPVLNTGESANDYYTEGCTHLDQITLMVSSSAAYIGYGASSADAYKHKDCCALAGAKAIDDWVDSDEAKALNLPDYGAPVYDAKWNRSFVGLDFEGLNKEDAYRNPAVTVKATDFRQDNTNYVIYQNDIVSADAFDWNIELTYKGEAVKYLDDQVANEAFGEKMKIDGNQVTKSTFTKDLNKASLEAEYSKTLAGNNDVRVFNFDQLLGYIGEGCAPTYSDKNMVNLTGARDYVYSDWIVTLTEAKKVEKEEDSDDVCIIAEDLNADDPSDFDFNDVVFAVRYTSDSKAEIEVYAAGATQPIWIGSSTNEVHKLFADANNNPSLAEADSKTGLYKMINTGAKADVNNLVHPKFEVSTNKSLRGSDIQIWVNKLEKVSEGVYKDVNNWIQLTAKQGDPAAKLCVGVDFAEKYCDEREDIRKKYPMFYNWVKDHPTLIWWY